MKTYYKSELKELEGKEFTDVKELEEAEAKVTTENAKKEIALAEKKRELAKINTAANDYLKLVAIPHMLECVPFLLLVNPL